MREKIKTTREDNLLGCCWREKEEGNCKNLYGKERESFIIRNN